MYALVGGPSFGTMVNGYAWRVGAAHGPASVRARKDKFKYPECLLPSGGELKLLEGWAEKGLLDCGSGIADLEWQISGLLHDERIEEW